MTQPASTSKKPRKKHTTEFRLEVLKLAERIGMVAEQPATDFAKRLK